MTAAVSGCNVTELGKDQNATYPPPPTKKGGKILRTTKGNYLLLLTGEREYGETVFPSSSGRALLVLTAYYKTQGSD